MAKLPRGELHLVDGAGHLCWFDDPVEVSGRVRRFLSASGTDQPRDSGVEAPVVLLRSFHVVATTRSRTAVHLTRPAHQLRRGLAARSPLARFSCLRETL